MKSERARAFLDRKSPKKVHPISGKETYGLLSWYDAERAVELAEEDAERAAQALYKECRDDEEWRLIKWKKTDEVIWKQHNAEIAAYEEDISKYKREIEELKQRLAIAEKVIADKNKESRK